MTLMVLPFGDK